MGGCSSCPGKSFFIRGEGSLACLIKQCKLVLSGREACNGRKPDPAESFFFVSLRIVRMNKQESEFVLSFGITVYRRFSKPSSRLLQINFASGAVSERIAHSVLTFNPSFTPSISTRSTLKMSSATKSG